MRSGRRSYILAFLDVKIFNIIKITHIILYMQLEHASHTSVGHSNSIAYASGDYVVYNNIGVKHNQLGLQAVNKFNADYLKRLVFC